MDVFSKTFWSITIREVLSAFLDVECQRLFDTPFHSGEESLNSVVESAEWVHLNDGLLTLCLKFLSPEIVNNKI